MAEDQPNSKENMPGHMRNLAFLIVTLVCSLAHATTTDTLVDVSPTGELQFALLKSAVLANVALPDSAAGVTFLSSLKTHSMQYETLDTDRYGRAQILLYDGTTSLTVQQQMLQRGIAITYITTHVRKTPDWDDDEASARAAQRGYWAQTNHVLTPETAAQSIGQFALVRGAITNIYRARDAYYINFGERWQDDFSIKIPRKNWRSLADLTDRIEPQLRMSDDLKNRRLLANPQHPVTVQVRGTLISENGPMIVVTRPEQLEILPNAKPKP